MAWGNAKDEAAAGCGTPGLAQPGCTLRGLPLTQHGKSPARSCFCFAEDQDFHLELEKAVQQGNAWAAEKGGMPASCFKLIFSFSPSPLVVLSYSLAGMPKLGAFEVPPIMPAGCPPSQLLQTGPGQSRRASSLYPATHSLQLLLQLLPVGSRATSWANPH